MIRIAKLARSLYRNNNGIVDIPRILTYIVTFNCNAKCIMCDSWKKESKSDLTIAEVERILKQLPILDAVRLSGGEPFVRQDINQIGELVQDILRPVVMHITTNGILTDRIIDYCEKRNKRSPLNLMVSIDGMKEKHNFTRGTGIAWDKAIETIKELSKDSKKLNIKMFVNQTIIDDESLDHYKRLRDFLKKYNIHNNVVIAYNESATYNVDSNKDVSPGEKGELQTFPEQFEKNKLNDFLNEVINDVSCYSYEQKIAKNYYIKGIRNRLLKQKGFPNPKCVALNSHMRLYPDGKVPVCQFNSVTVGNLKEQTFEDIWYGGKIESFRKWVQKCPGCWAECEVLPNAFYSGDIIREAVMPMELDR